jgi:single-strand DNA-binding protein
MFNQVTIGGRITQDLELKATTNGTPVLNFSIAINEKRGEEERTVFVDITIWKEVAENTAKYMKKGQPVLVSGRLSQDSWEDHGQHRTKLFVTGERVVFLGQKVEAERGEEQTGFVERELQRKEPPEKKPKQAKAR